MKKAETTSPKNGQRRKKPGLPRFLRPLFWEYDFRELNWDEDQHLVTRRVLCRGGTRAVAWLRARRDDAALRDWLRSCRGRGLDVRELRYWQVMLDLTKEEVDAWLADPGRQIWDRRGRR